MLESMGIFEVAAKAATMKGVKAVHVSLTADGLCCVNAYDGTNYADENCKAARLYLAREETKAYNRKEINEFLKIIKKWKNNK